VYHEDDGAPPHRTEIEMTRPILLLAALTLALCACRGSAPAQEEPAPAVVRVYTVAPDRADQIRSALAGVLTTSKDDGGHVTALPDGHVLVLAQPRVHASIAEALKQLDAPADAHAPGPMTAVRLKFWIVDADGAAGDDDAALAPIRDALAAVKDPLGAKGFALHDAIATSANLEGEWTNARTAARTEIEYRLRPARDGVRATLQIKSDAGIEFHTTTTVPFDQTVVLAQLNAGENPAKTHARLYLVRAEKT
jgi:hypothetical protein